MNGRISSIYNFLNEKKITKFCTLKEISKLNDNKKLKITSAKANSCKKTTKI